MAVVDTFTIGGFDGLNNRLAPTKLVHRTPDNATATYLSKADNVDISEDRTIRRRGGRTLVIPGKAHSLWADDKGAVAVVDGQLLALSADLAPTVLRTGMPSARLSYSRGADGALYWSNGIELRKISQGSDLPIAERQPGRPGVAVGAGGLPAGRYLVAITIDGPAGESAPSEPMAVAVSGGGALTLTAPLLAGQKLRAYISGPNGDVLTFAGESGAGVLFIPTYQGDGRVLSTRLAPMPAGQLVAHSDARLVVAAGNVVWFSRPWHYGMTDPVVDYIPLPGRVTILAPVPTGLFICADKTYFLPPGGAQLREVLPFGGVEGTAGRIPEDGRVFWHSPRGLVIAAPDGSAAAVQDDVLTFPAAQSGASLWRERDGSRHILASTAGREVSSAAASISFEVRD